MTTITGTFLNNAGRLAEGYVTIAATSPRPSRTLGPGVITTDPERYELIDGTFTTDVLDPGEVVLRARGPGLTYETRLNLPETGSHQLRDILNSEIDYEPPVIREAQKAALAAAEAADTAEASRRAARDYRDETIGLRDETQGLVDSIPDLELTLDWSDLENVPVVFPPISHTHLSADITDADSCSTNSVLVRRDDDGLFCVVEPTENAHPTPMWWVNQRINEAIETASGMTEEELDRIRDMAAAMEEGGSALESIMQQLDLKMNSADAVYSRDAGASVPRRNESGQLSVPSTPNADDHATSRGYVDSAIGDVDSANRTWTSAQIDALAQLVDDQSGQIAALQDTVTSLQTELSEHKAEAVTSDNIRTIRRSAVSPSNENPAPTDQVTFVHEDMQED